MLDAATPLLEAGAPALAAAPSCAASPTTCVPAVPALANLSRQTPPFLEQARSLASCFNQVIIPWSMDEVEGGPGYTHPAVGEVYKETAYGLAGISGESRSQDANGQYIRVAGGGGTNTVDDDRPGRRDARRRHAAADRRRDALAGRLGEDAVQARGAV